jgi:signal transduction histidine kinase
VIGARLRGSPRWPVVLAVGGAIVCFVAATAVSELRARDVGNLAWEIAYSAEPGIRHLAAARGDLRDLRASIDRYLDSGDEKLRAEVGAEQERVSTELAAYRALPGLVRDAPGARDLDPAAEAVHAVVARLATSHDGSRSAATAEQKEQFRTTIDRAKRTIERLMAFHVDRAASLALSIEREQKSSSRFAFALDGFSAVLAVLAAAFALRALRRHDELADSHRDLLERRARELDQFAARVAHDVLSPATAALLSLHALDRRLAADHEGRPYAARARMALERMRSIIDGLLDFARSGAERDADAETPLASVCLDVLEGLRPLALDQRIELSCEPLPAVFVACHAGLLASVVGNLVRNAIKHMGDAAVRTVIVRARVDANAVRIEVEDSGPGVPAGYEKRIFEPYLRAPGAASGGLGLGLATVQRIATAHGGAVGVERARGAGSVFWVELPAVFAAGDPRRSATRRTARRDARERGELTRGELPRRAIARPTGISAARRRLPSEPP